MRTTIKRTLQGFQMEKMFDTEHDKISIRYYNACCTENNYNNTERYKFEILIQHAEKTDGVKLFDDAFNKLFPSKIKREKTINKKVLDQQPDIEMHPIFADLLKPFGIK
jgi:hypothetical protein